ncbi:hypothetical protein [Lichenicoccus roseus]|uniref:Uncharacterized protein n=1 Tax=Lichenicoccus roseus TaxID=2683649 RepID=A0A5R9J5E2_9PROT|nr:hypothetical protein [Lichenicoccus roseus]TLU72772.1 hypothetical protein FE263_12200 [Lichenicoccus roseus]
MTAARLPDLALLLALPVAPLLASLAAGPACAATFTVHDKRADRELSETTELYVDGQRVAAFALDAAHDQISLPVTVAPLPGASGERHSYVLCGLVTVRNGNGAPEVHEVNGTGILLDPAGRSFEALAADDFTLFYLADPTNTGAATHAPWRSGLCHAAVS